jgi:hypothetical protein
MCRVGADSAERVLAVRLQPPPTRRFCATLPTRVGGKKEEALLATMEKRG